MFTDAIRVAVVRGQRAAVYNTWDAAEADVKIGDRIEVTRPNRSVECYEAVSNVMDALGGSIGWHPVRRDC